jgi:hypothetical protein
MKTRLRVLTLMFVAAFANGGEQPKVGSVAKNGNLIMHIFNSVDDPPVPLPVELKDDYGFMIFNVGTLEAPKLKVIVGLRKDKKLSEATTWEDSDKLLAKIPKGSSIHYYGKCLCPTFYGLPEDTWDRMQALIKKHNLTYEDTQDRITCDCYQNGG